MTVFKRGNHWHYDFTYKKRRYRGAIKEARTKPQAKHAEACIRSTLSEKQFEKKYGLVETPETPFNKYVKETFLPFSKLHKKSYQDDVYITRILEAFFGSTPLQDITPEMIEEYKHKRLDSKTNKGTKRTPARVKRELSVLSKIFSMAFKKRLIDDNPCRRIEALPKSGKRNRVLSPDEEKRLYAALDGQEWVQNIITMALHTGMRQGEIFNLRWFDVDFPRGSIYVRNTKNSEDRTVPMNDVIREMLGRLRRSSEYVFPSPKTGKRIVDIKSTFDKARKAAKLVDFRFHDLRHTAATRMADNPSTTAFTLASIFGWLDIKMALRYAHATDQAKRNAVENLTGQPQKSPQNENGRPASLPKS